MKALHSFDTKFIAKCVVIVSMINRDEGLFLVCECNLLFNKFPNVFPLNSRPLAL